MNKLHKISHSVIVQRMRPLQKKAAELIISDILKGKSPVSIDGAIRKYALRLGDGFEFDTGKGWRGEIRETAIFCLINNGFKKAKVVEEKSGKLSKWSNNENELRAGADLEILYGGLISNAALVQEITNAMHKWDLGDGPEAVYVYGDSVYDNYKVGFLKIGRHQSSEVSSVANRIIEQFGTGNAGKPIGKLLVKTPDAKGLETALHREFAKKRLTGGIGTEWFEVTIDEILDSRTIKNFVTLGKPKI